MSGIAVIELISKTFKEYPMLPTILIIVILSLVQVSPIKINPWTAISKIIQWILEWIGKHLFKSMTDRIDAVDHRLQKLEVYVDENEIDRIRHEILTFANSCQRGINHTKRDFQHIFKLNRKYHEILERMGRTNGEVDDEIDYLYKIDAEKREHDSYLT